MLGDVVDNPPLSERVRQRARRTPSAEPIPSPNRIARYRHPPLAPRDRRFSSRSEPTLAPIFHIDVGGIICHRRMHDSSKERASRSPDRRDVPGSASHERSPTRSPPTVQSVEVRGYQKPGVLWCIAAVRRRLAMSMDSTVVLKWTICGCTGVMGFRVRPHLEGLERRFTAPNRGRSRCG